MPLLHQSRDIQARNHRPETVIVIQIWLVLDLLVEMVRLQGSPLWVAGTDDGPEGGQEHTPYLWLQTLYVLLSLLPLLAAAQIGQQRQGVGQAIEVEDIAAGRKGWQPV